MNDEARHIEVFTKRANANGGGFQYSSEVTQRSLFHYLKKMIILKALFYFMLWEKELLLIY